MAIDLNEQISLDLGDEFKEESDNKYTKKLKIPQYEPTSDTAPEIYMLFDKQKYVDLYREIEKANIDDDVKKIFEVCRNKTYSV